MMKHSALISLFFLFLISCTPEVKFEKPQPLGKRNLKEFPKKYRGKYINLIDSSILIINSKIIIREWRQFTTILKDSLFAELDTIFEKDTVIKLSENWLINVKFNGDSAKIKSKREHVVFSITDKNKLRKYKGYLFLNNYLYENAWDVEVLKKNNGSLMFEKLVYASEIDSLIEIVNVEMLTDTLTDEVREYLLKPKRRELRQILKAKKEGRTYKKMSSP